jgi:hypothetical protein
VITGDVDIGGSGREMNFERKLEVLSTGKCRVYMAFQAEG